MASGSIAISINHSGAAQTGRGRHWPAGPALPVDYPHGTSRRGYFQRAVHGLKGWRVAHPGLDPRHHRLSADGAVSERGGRQGRNAGGYFVIQSVALGHFVGFTTSWLWFLFEPLVPVALSMLFGQVLSDFLVAELGVRFRGGLSLSR
jgi:hypothetical protein